MRPPTARHDRLAPIGAPAGRSCEPEIRLLNGFALDVRAQPVDVPESAQKLIAALALVGSLRRTALAGLLWPDCDERRAEANLRSARWRLPREVAHFVETCGQRVRLSSEVIVDVVEHEAAGWRVVTAPETVRDEDLWPGLLVPVLPGWCDDWVLFERERRLQLGMRFGEAIIVELVRRGRLVEALDHALRLVSLDPFRESGQRALITVYLAEGNRSQAVVQLSRYRQLLRDELGCDCFLTVEEVLCGLV